MIEIAKRVKRWAAQQGERLVQAKVNNDEEARLARLFITLMAISTAIVTLLVAVFISMIPVGLSDLRTIYIAASFPFAFIPLSTYCIWLAKRGTIKFSIRLYVWVNFISISIAAWLFDGVNSPAWILYIWTITIAGTLLMPVYSLWLTSGVFAYYSALFLLSKLNLYTPPLSFGEDGREYASIAFLVIMLISTVGLLTYLNMKSLHKAFHELRDEIAERKQTEIELHESYEKYRMVADFTYDWEYWMGPDRKYIYISPSCKRTTGYEPEAFLNDPDLLISIIHPHDRLMFTKHHDEVMDSGSEVKAMDFRIITKSGNERWISHTCRSVSSSTGKWLGRRGNNRDITDRKAIEEVLRKSKTSSVQLRRQ